MRTLQPPDRGTGVKPEDVILDAGLNYQGTGGGEADGWAKDVVLRVDRADGFVGRNFLTQAVRPRLLQRGGRRHLPRSRGRSSERGYGHLSFTSDHNVVQNCDGSAPVTPWYTRVVLRRQRSGDRFWFDAPRINTVIRDRDLHGSALGFSGSMGNAVRITNNHVYGNTTGISRTRCHPPATRASPPTAPRSTTT